MQTIEFEDAIAELLDQIYSAMQKDQELVAAQSSSMIVAPNRSSLRLVPKFCEANSSENTSK